MSRLARLLLLLALTAPVAAQAQAQVRPDPDRDRLLAELTAMDQDPALADMAGLERFRAKQAVTTLPGLKARERPQALELAQLWVDTAKAAAQAQHLEALSRQLDQERDQIMLEASRRDAELARREADRLRLQTQAQQEEAERVAAAAELDRQAGAKAAADAQAEAAQARKLADAREREAKLAREEARLAAQVGGPEPDDATPPTSRLVGGKIVYTLSGDAFATGSNLLTEAARASLQTLTKTLAPGAKLLIVGYTDSQGQAAANLALSLRRAEAVRQALIDLGIASNRLKASGKGQANPVASNGSEAGRARNRRVELIVQ